MRIAFALLAAALLGCSGAPSAPTDVPPTSDLAADAGDAPDADDAPDVPDTAPPPYDAGPAPPCSLAPAVRRLAARPANVRPTDPGGLVPAPGGFLVAARNNTREVFDAGVPVPARDTIDLYAVAADGTPRGDAVTIHSGGPERTDLFTPVLLPTREGALAVFSESRATPASGEFVQRIRSIAVPAGGAVGAPALVRDRHGEPFAAALPDGTALVVAARIVSTVGGDAGIVLATPVSLHLDARGAPIAPSDVDLNPYLPASARFPLLRPAPDGAVLVYRLGAEVHALRWFTSGAFDNHGAYIARSVRAPALDDAAALDDAVVVAWAEHDGATVTVKAAVLDRRGPTRAVLTLDAFPSDAPTTATVVAAHGGAAVLWRQGSGATTRVRVAVVQPDGLVRAPAADLVTAPDVVGRLVARASGRELTFVARDAVGGAAGFSVGRACLPE